LHGAYRAQTKGSGVLRTRLCELLGIMHPIINAPMAGPAKAELAAAVAEAGGLGLIGGSSGDAEWLRQQIRAVRERTDRPFGVGFISSFPGLDRLVATAIEERVPVITHSFADPTPYVAAAHAAGILVLAQVQTVAQVAENPQYAYRRSFRGVEEELNAVEDVLDDLDGLGQSRSIELPMGADDESRSGRERARGVALDPRLAVRRRHKPWRRRRRAHGTRCLVTGRRHHQLRVPGWSWSPAD